MTDKFCPLMQGHECNPLCGFYSKDIECCEIIAIAKQVLELDKTERKETFLARIAKGWRICLYEPVRDNLGFEIGDLLRVTVRLEKKSCEIPPPRTRTSPPKIEAITEPDEIEEPVDEELEDPIIEEETVVPLVKDVADEPQEEKPTEEVLEPPHTEEVTTVTGADEETIVFDDDPEPEESITAEITEPSVPDYTEELEEEVNPEYEYVDPCVKGLDRPLEDLNICRKCEEYYKRRWGKRPAQCTWDGWLKVGWEDDVKEEPVKDIVEEPTQEPEEPIEEATETEPQIVMLYCESGAHEAQETPHMKRISATAGRIIPARSATRKHP